MTAAQRRATGDAARMGTGMGSRMGTGAAMGSMKEALTETLVKKMRAKFGAEDIGGGRGVQAGTQLTHTSVFTLHVSSS
jgi:hypothetical protein